jgi:hypothetical protein
MTKSFVREAMLPGYLSFLAMYSPRASTVFENCFLSFVETMENGAVHLFGIALKSRANTGCSGRAAAVPVSATAATASSASSSAATSTGSTAAGYNWRRCDSITHDGVSWVQKSGSERTLFSTSVEKTK